MRDFGLDDGHPDYQLEIKSGRLISQRYILDVDGKEEFCFSGKISGKLISSLPIAVSNLNNNWSAYLYNGKLKKARPIGVFENKAWATIIPNEDLNLFVGHPITADNPDIMIQLTQIEENNWQLEIHNPTDKTIKTEIRKNPNFDPLKENSFKQGIMEMKAGSSIWKKF